MKEYVFYWFNGLIDSLHKYDTLKTNHYFMLSTCNKYLYKSFTVHGELVEPLAANTSTSSVRTVNANKLSYGYLSSHL